MKSVDVKKYDKEYFESKLTSVDYHKKVSPSDFKPLHRNIATLLKNKPTDFIIDYGCGNGDLSFLLALQYKSRVLGIDYSKDAIILANKNRRLLSKTKSLDLKHTSFISCPNNKLPSLSGVTLIYLADVIEHLYHGEIDIIIKKFLTWNDKNLKIVIHTDNNDYLQYIRPFIDTLSVIMRKTTIKQIKARNEWERERHVNLTTPRELTKKFKNYGFKVTKLKYSPITRQNIQSQLGSLRSVPFLVISIYKLGNLFSFLLPSFYIILQRQKK